MTGSHTSRCSMFGSPFKFKLQVQQKNHVTGKVARSSCLSLGIQRTPLLLHRLANLLGIKACIVAPKMMACHVALLRRHGNELSLAFTRKSAVPA